MTVIHCKRDVFFNEIPLLNNFKKAPPTPGFVLLFFSCQLIADVSQLFTSFQALIVKPGVHLPSRVEN